MIDDMIAVAIGVEAGKSAVQIAREYRGLSRDELADLVGTTAEAILSLDEGEVPAPKVLAALSLALNVPAGLLLE